MTYDLAEEAAHFMLDKFGSKPDAALVLGSGLSEVASILDGAISIGFSEIPHFPVPAVEGHGGHAVMGSVGTAQVLILCGRVHLYEGHPVGTVVLPVRALRQMGIGELLLTNAAGAIGPDFEAGDLMRISDHINLTAVNPLTGRNEDRWGPRFPDQSQVYDASLGRRLAAAAERTGMVLPEGVYAGVAGPTYETPAEIRFLRTIGADAVGMSTVHEAIVANHMGMRVAALSVLTNKAAGLSEYAIRHDEVLEGGRTARTAMKRIFEEYFQAPEGGSPP